MRKVRARIRQGDFSQDPWITKCNDVADKLAKAAAHGLFQEKLQVLMPLLVSAVELQVFLVHVFATHNSQNYLTGGEDRCKPLKILTTKTCSCAPTPRMELAGDENRAIECVRLLEPIPPDVLGRLRSHYSKYMRIAEQPAVWGPLGANIRAIPVQGFSLEAVQTICRYLNLPIWCSVPNGDLVRCSWINFLVILRPGSDVSLRSSLPGNLPGGTHRRWQDVLLLFSIRERL